MQCKGSFLLLFFLNLNFKLIVLRLAGFCFCFCWKIRIHITKLVRWHISWCSPWSNLQAFLVVKNQILIMLSSLHLNHINIVVLVWESPSWWLFFIFHCWDLSSDSSILVFFSERFIGLRSFWFQLARRLWRFYRSRQLVRWFFLH